MDKLSITTCRIYVALNALQTANLSDSELDELEDKVVGIIDKATHKRTAKFLKEKKSNTEEKRTEKGPEQVTNIPAANPTPSVTKATQNITETSDKKASVNSTDNTGEKKRVRWDCNTCVSKCDKDKGTSGMCERCYDVYERMGKTNSYYQRKVKEVPENCSKCPFCKMCEDTGRYMCSVNYLEHGDNHATHPYIRSNYLTKNRPSYCKLNF